jgi:hypothetical protein
MLWRFFNNLLSKTKYTSCRFWCQNRIEVVFLTCYMQISHTFLYLSNSLQSNELRADSAKVRFFQDLFEYALIRFAVQNKDTFST